MPIVITKPFTPPTFAEEVLALDPNMFLEMKTGALGVNSSTRVGAPDASTVQSVLEISGPVDGGGDFNGASYIRVPSHTTTDSIVTAGNFFTFEFIIKFPIGNPASSEMILARGQDTLNREGYVIQRRNDGKGVINIFRNGNWQRWSSSAALPQGSWFHLVFSGKVGHFVSDEKIYVNGLEVANIHESNAGGVLQIGTHDIMVGAGLTPSDQLPAIAHIVAEYDTVVAYDQQLSDAQVLVNAQAAGLA